LVLSVGLVLVAGQGRSARAEEAKAPEPQILNQAETKSGKKHRSPPSVCVGLSESACAGNAACYWRKAITTKAGKQRKAHCRKKPQQMAKQITPT
jgi:hypothetical protein